MNVEIQQSQGQTVAQLSDAESGTSAKILVSYGCNCFSLVCQHVGRAVELLASDVNFADQPSRPSGNGFPILFPFPNRIRAGSFFFEGKRYTLPRNEANGNNAIHGFVHDRPWRVLRSDDHLVSEFQLSVDAPDLNDCWPADFVIRATHRVTPSCLETEYEIDNPDSRPLPWGLGVHPYFRLPINSSADEKACQVTAPASGFWELVDCLPTGKVTTVPADRDLRSGRTLFGTLLDDVYTGLSFDSGECRCSLIDKAAKSKLTYSFDDNFAHLVVYIPPTRGSVCIEPYTCVTDAANLSSVEADPGWQVLAPGQSKRLKMKVVLEALREE